MSVCSIHECFTGVLGWGNDWEWQDLMEWGGLKGGEEEVRRGAELESQMERGSRR